MTGKPRKRAARGLVEHPWRDDPSLSSRPPFEPGNDVAVTHGALSPRRVAPLAAAAVERLRAVAPWAADRPAFLGSVESLAWCEAQLELVRAYLDDVGLLDGDGQPRAVCNLLDRLEGRAARLRDALGLSPMALAKLLGTLATVAVAGHDDDGLAHLKAEGRRIIEARRLAAVPEGDGAA